MTRNIWVLAFVLLSSLLFYTNRPQETFFTVSNASIKFGERPLIIGYSNWSGWWPWAIAESEGLFDRHGVNAELRWYDDYTKSLEDLAAGYIDGNCQTLNDTITFADGAVKGEKVVLVNDNSAGNDKIIVTSDINSVTDLKGKQVAVEAGVVDDFLLTLALKRSNMSREDVIIVDAETGAASEAFFSSQVDAVGAFPPFWLTALKRPGSKEIVSSAEFPGAIPDLLVVTNESVARRPEQIQKIVEVWFDILDFIDRYPIKADRIMAQKAGVSKQEFELFKAGTKMFTLADNINAFERRNDMSSLDYASKQIKYFLNENFIDQNIQVGERQIFAPQFIRALD